MNVKMISIFGILLAVGVLLGGAADRMIFGAIVCREDFEFLNPDLRCRDSLGIDKREYAPFKAELEKWITEKKEQGQLTAAAVYFRDLNNGPYFGINEKEPFVPASLLKLPVLLMYLDAAGDDPELLSQQLELKEERGLPKPFFEPKETIEMNKPYTVDDLLRRMIVYSDNRAYDALIMYFGTDRVFATLQELGLTIENDIEKLTFSAKSYAALFRILYNASYLSKKMSSRALTLLTHVDFSGMAGGVPDDVAVAHKFGERGFANGVEQLHDCGIIYYPGNPYLLCIMTRGTDFTVLAGVIRDISEAVYREVDSRRIAK